MESALPLVHPERLTISWITDATFGVCSFGPASLVTVHTTGNQDTDVAVRVRADILKLAVVKAAEFSTASARMSTVVGFVQVVSLAVNWM